MTPGEAHVRALIAREGPIPFARFMQEALYAPAVGYYRHGLPRVGFQGDFYTSPEVHPAFGVCLARWLAWLWERMGRPEPFTVVEHGAGQGSLARQILAAAERLWPDFAQALRYLAVEVDGRRRPVLPGSTAPAVSSGGQHATDDDEASQGAPGLAEFDGCVLSNELLDALPVHVVRREGNALQELYVGVAHGNLVEQWGEPSTPRLAAYFEALGLRLPEGGRYEVNLAMLDWLAEASAPLTRGAVLTLDYGYAAADLYHPRRRHGTLLAFYRHTLSSDLLARVGEQDLTAHIDFTSLALEGERLGLRPCGWTTQAALLRGLGIEEVIRALPERGLPPAEERRNRRALLELLDADGLGRIRALFQAKGLSCEAAPGFFDPPDHPPPPLDPARVPLLGEVEGGGGWPDPVPPPFPHEDSG